MDTIKTVYGDFVAMYTESDGFGERIKKRRRPVIYHKNGNIKSIALETQTNVKTPLGIYPAELVTFYEDGSLNRVFPLNGEINGYWSEDDEGEMAKEYPFKFEFGQFTAKLMCLRFYPTGELKALTLWPGTHVTLKTPVGEMAIKTGFSLYKNGKLKSIEPEKPKAIHTSIGSFLTYDPDALGIHADSGSIGFDEAGHITRFKTAINGVIVTKPDGMILKVGPRAVQSYVDISEMVIMPVSVSFEKDEVVIDNGIIYRFKIANHKFQVYVSELELRTGCTDCSSCTSCDH